MKKSRRRKVGFFFSFILFVISLFVFYILITSIYSDIVEGVTTSFLPGEDNGIYRIFPQADFSSVSRFFAVIVVSFFAILFMSIFLSISITGMAVSSHKVLRYLNILTILINIFGILLVIVRFFIILF